MFSTDWNRERPTAVGQAATVILVEQPLGIAACVCSADATWPVTVLEGRG